MQIKRPLVYVQVTEEPEPSSHYLNGIVSAFTSQFTLPVGAAVRIRRGAPMEWFQVNGLNYVSVNEKDVQPCVIVTESS